MHPIVAQVVAAGGLISLISAQELSSDEDEPRKRPAKRRASGGRGRGAAAAEASDESEYDDGYGSDLMGDDDDRAQ